MDIAEFIRNGVEAWNKRDKDAFLADFDSDCEITGPGGMVLRGRDGAEMFWHGYQDAFPDNQVVLRAGFGSDGAGTEEAVFEGTHTGVLHGPDGSQIPPTGKHIVNPFVTVYTYRDDKVATFHLYFDQIELLTQLGLMPAPVG